MKHFNKHVQCLSCLNPQIGKRTKDSKIFTVPSRPKKKRQFLEQKGESKTKQIGAKKVRFDH